MRSVVSGNEDSGRPRSGKDTTGAGDDVGVLPVPVGGDDPVTTGRGSVVGNVGADLADRAGDENAGVGPGISHWWDGSGQCARGGIRRNSRDSNPVGPAPGSGVQG